MPNPAGPLLALLSFSFAVSDAARNVKYILGGSNKIKIHKSTPRSYIVEMWKLTEAKMQLGVKFLIYGAASGEKEFEGSS